MGGEQTCGAAASSSSLCWWYVLFATVRHDLHCGSMKRSILLSSLFYHSCFSSSSFVSPAGRPPLWPRQFASAPGEGEERGLPHAPLHPARLSVPAEGYDWGQPRKEAHGTRLYALNHCNFPRIWFIAARFEDGSFEFIIIFIEWSYGCVDGGLLHCRCPKVALFKDCLFALMFHCIVKKKKRQSKCFSVPMKHRNLHM